MGLSGSQLLGHLLRRAGFGQGAGTEAFEGNLAYEDAVERLLAGLSTPPPPQHLPGASGPGALGFDPYRPGAIQSAWTARILAGEAPLAERLTLFWHGHFATSQAKVADGLLMWRQNLLFRTRGGGRFADLVLAVSRDVAMVRWLDGNSNRKGRPNENYARELQELFALGRGRYTEADIREIARAFSGWGSRHHDFLYSPEFHDDGEKVIHGQTGKFGGEDAVRIVTTLPACAPYMCARLLRYFAHPDPTDGEVEALAAVWRASDGDLTKVLRALFLSPAFRESSRLRALVKSPVDYVASAARLTGRRALPAAVEGSMDRLGQVLFRPPSVKGWPSGTAWLTAGTSVERLRAAEAFAEGVDASRVDALLEREWGGSVPAPLERALKGTRGTERLTLALASPEFQVA
jgi:uncharacterized protein (DUF1800 family)